MGEAVTHSQVFARELLPQSCLVQTFAVDFMPTKLNSIPEKLTLLLVDLKARVS